MTVIGLFLTSAALLATLWAGKVALLDAVLIWTAVAAVTDLVASVTGYLRQLIKVKQVEVVLDGMAEGSAKEGLRQQGRDAARKSGAAFIPFFDPEDDGKAD